MKRLKILSFIITALSVITIFVIGRNNYYDNEEMAEEKGQVENIIQEETIESNETSNQQENQDVVEEQEQEIAKIDNTSTSQESTTQSNTQQDLGKKETSPSKPIEQTQTQNVKEATPKKNASTTTQSQSQPQKQQSTTPPNSGTTDNKETFKVNNSIINKMQNVINSNPSSFMKQFGYNIVVDSSIVNKTTGFTYTETRVKNAIANSFGTIRIYAQDYYVGNELRWTQSFIL